MRIVYSGNLNTQQGLKKRQGGDESDWVDCMTGGLVQAGQQIRDLQAAINGDFQCAANQRRLRALQLITAGLAASETMDAMSPVGFFLNLVKCSSEYISKKTGWGQGRGSAASQLSGGGSGDGGPSGNGAFGGYDAENFCFAKGTLIWMADGSHKAIEHVKAGDWIKTGPKNEHVAKVAGNYTQISRRMQHLCYQTDDKTQRTLSLTIDHYVWKDGEGWIMAGGIKPGDLLVNEHGASVVVLSNDSALEETRVYTLHLRSEQCFYANGVLVHDLCGPPPPDSISHIPKEAP